MLNHTYLAIIAPTMIRVTYSNQDTVIRNLRLIYFLKHLTRENIQEEINEKGN